MSPENPTCREIEPDLVAVAAGEAGASAARGVERHVAVCRDCRDELARYRVLEGMVADLRRAPVAGADPTLARAELESRLADIRSRMVAYGIFESPLGKLLIARSELGVSMVRYIDSERSGESYLARLAGDEAVEDKSAVEATYRELLDYLGARSTRLTGRSTSGGRGATSSGACSRRRRSCPMAPSRPTRGSRGASARPSRCAPSPRRSGTIPYRSPSRVIA